MDDPKHQLRHERARFRRGVAAALTAGLMIPGAVAIAKPPTGNDAARPERTVRADVPAWRLATRPAVQVDKFYKGPLEGAIGSHVWTGDIFGSGVATAVSFEIALDEAGVPMVTNVVVDEATLPEGVTYEIRGTSTETGGGESTTSTTSTTMPVVETSAEASETSDTTVAGEDTTTTTVDQDEADPTFASGAGVRFSMGDQKAGLLILANGRLGEEPAIAVRTVLVTTPIVPVVDDEDDEETTTSTTVEEPERDKGDRNQDRNRDRDVDRSRGDRDARRSDRGGDAADRDDRRGDRGSDGRRDYDKPPTNS